MPYSRKYISTKSCIIDQDNGIAFKNNKDIDTSLGDSKTLLVLLSHVTATAIIKYIFLKKWWRQSEAIGSYHVSSSEGHSLKETHHFH